MVITDVTPDHQVKRAVEESMSNQDRVMLAIMKFRKDDSLDIYQTVDDFAGEANLTGMQTYQCMHRLAQLKKIEILKEAHPTLNGRTKIVGVRLLKSEAPEQIIADGVEKAKNHRNVTKKLQKTLDLKNLNEYMQRKIAVERAKDILVEAGLDEVEVSRTVTGLFDPNPIAEEAILLYSEWNKSVQENVELMLENEKLRKTIEVSH